MFLDEEFSLFMKITEYNFFIVLLLFLLYVIIISIIISYKFRLNLLFFLLFFMLKTLRFLYFYFIYEIVFVFIIFVILVLGYRYERLRALYLILFYSFIFSSPCLLVMLRLDYIFLIKGWLSYSAWILWVLIASFIVKFPIFGFHYWLPVAHVEASTVGSILLAGILLKLGGIGIFYLVCYCSFIVKFHWLVVSVLLTILLILNLRDLKIMIAYSSIAHIRLVFYVLNLGSYVAKKGVLIIIFYHGFISPLIFWLVGLFGWWKTRSLIVIKYINISFIFIIIVFFLLILNIRFPPFIGFLREILIFKALVKRKWILRVAILSVLFRCYYNIYLFWSFVSGTGWRFKVYFSNLDVYIVMRLVVLINFY